MPEGDIEGGRVGESVEGSASKWLWTLKQQAVALVQIHRKDELRLLLADWEERFKFATSRIDRKEALGNHVKNEIYQLIGFFIVFQGVVLTTISQSNKLRWWSPFALSAIATVVILGGVVLKSFDYIKWRNGAKQEQRYARITYLKLHGKDVDFDKHDSSTQKHKRPMVRAKDWIIAGVFVSLVVSLIGFAAVVLLSCHSILCPDLTDPGA